MRLLEAGRLDEACAKLEEAFDVGRGIGTQFHLASCYEKQGRSASASRAYEQVLAATIELEQKERSNFVRNKLAALEPRLHKIVIEPRRPAPQMTVTLDGKPLPEAEWRTPFAIDPGTHTIEASAPQRTTWRQEVSSTREGQTISIAIPPLTSSSPSATEQSGLEPPSSGTPATSSWSTQQTWGLVTWGVGATGLVLGAVFGALAVSKKDDSSKFCSEPTVCVQPGADLVRDAQTFADVATVALIAGGALVIAGSVIYLTAPDDAVAVGLTPVAVTMRW